MRKFIRLGGHSPTFIRVLLVFAVVTSLGSVYFLLELGDFGSNSGDALSFPVASNISVPSTTSSQLVPFATSNISELLAWASNQRSSYEDLQDYMARLMDQNCPAKALEELRNSQINPPSNRTLVFSTFKNGLCDRTNTAVGLFYLAHFAGRSFKMEWLCSTENLKKSKVEACSTVFMGYDCPYFQLQSNGNNIPIKDSTQKHHHKHHFETDSLRFHAINGLQEDKDEVTNRFLMQNYDEWIPNSVTQYRIIQSSGGTVRLLLNNTHYKNWFKDHGFTRQSAFACGFNFLFQPTPLAFQGMEPYFNLLQREEFFKIGLHIRAYIDEDNQFQRQTKSKWPISKWMPLFSECALEIEEAWNTELKRPLWFVISDNDYVRKAFKENFGSRVLMMEDVKIVHAELSDDHGMLSSIREHWLFGMTDYHIVRDRTSFGKSAAVRGCRENSVYQVDQHLEKTKCDRLGYRPYEKLENDWIKF